MLPAVLAHAAALGTWAGFCAYEVRQNAALITANGSRDSLGLAFHFWRSLLRMFVAVALVEGCGVVAPGWGLRFGLGGLFVGYFGWYFNPALSRLRGLPPYYVSFSTTTALFDKLLASLARRACPDDRPAQERYAGRLLRAVLWTGLAAGVVGEVAGLVWG